MSKLTQNVPSTLKHVRSKCMKLDFLGIKISSVYFVFIYSFQSEFIPLIT